MAVLGIQEAGFGHQRMQQATGLLDCHKGSALAIRLN